SHVFVSAWLASIPSGAIPSGSQNGGSLPEASWTFLVEAREVGNVRKRQGCHLRPRLCRRTGRRSAAGRPPRVRDQSGLAGRAGVRGRGRVRGEGQPPRLEPAGGWHREGQGQGAAPPRPRPAPAAPCPPRPGTF